jgi:hypothetical protein
METGPARTALSSRQPGGVYLTLRSPWLWFLVVLAMYAALLLPTITRQGISWDEQTDLAITRAYLVRPDGWLKGSNIDPSQTRLPMASVALAYTLLGVSDLITARVVSVFVGALTLLGVFVYGKARFGGFQAVLACAILAASPFYLSFARVAFTETDIYLACAFIWLLICLAHFDERPGIARAAQVGVFLGIALSAKFTTLAVIPAVWFAIFSAIKQDSAVRRRAMTLTWPLLAVFVTILALVTFLLVPPEHLINPIILRSLLWRAGNEMSFNPGFMLESAALHILSILFKSTPLIGAGLLFSLGLAAFQWRREEVRVPLLFVVLYLGGLAILPISQTFYTVPLLPILSLLAADQFARFYSGRRAAALALAALAALGWGADMVLCYPDYNLNGYQYLGARPLLGRSSIGYRSVVQTPSDGVQQAVEWLNANAEPGDQVTAYVSPWHIVEAYAPNPSYRIESGMGREPFARPKYVVTHINDQLWQGWGANDSPPRNIFATPYDSAWLEANYNEVFRVPRAFGINAASVWKVK